MIASTLGSMILDAEDHVKRFLKSDMENKRCAIYLSNIKTMPS